MTGDMTGGWDWMSALGWIFIILFWALFILGVVGEFTRDQYERMRRDLE